MNTFELLLASSSQTGISGREDTAYAFFKEQLAPYGTVTLSPTNSIICDVKAPKKDGIHVLLDAHLDEIGLIVSHITEEGFLRVSAAGGIDTRVVLSSLINVHTRSGAVLTGVICSMPPHLQKGERKNPQIADLYIDVGLSGDGAKEQITIGDSITFRSKATALLNGMVRGKALDDRAGCVALLKALEYLGDEYDCGLSVVFSSMEEIGLKGATTSTFAVQPTHALAVDVSFAHTPDADRTKTGDLGKGPMIGFAPILRHEISARLVELAKEHTIPYQLEVMSGGTGTNSDAIAVSREGVRTALLSLPQRFMHTPNEVISVDDIENSGRLIALWIQDLAKGDA